MTPLEQAADAAADRELPLGKPHFHGRLLYVRAFRQGAQWQQTPKAHDHALCYAGFMAFIRGVDIPETTEQARLVLVERMLKAEARVEALTNSPSPSAGSTAATDQG